ncbi:MAG: PAS domain S-box protein [Desulfobacterales bacterium]|nr:PAS domain S-box protein [Deltaproteobacteria bacterium]NNL43723.1 PAS domain S-box protein [Desulfobacterales bacterium]
MKNLFKTRVSVADSMILIGILLAAVYWAIEAVLNLFTTQKVNIFYQLFPTNVDEIWPRVVVLCLFAIFGSHVRYTINERKKAEEALKVSEKKYRNILESIEEGYFEIDLKGNLTFFNDSVSRIMGYSREELMGMNNREYTSPETAKKMLEVYNRVYTTGKSQRVSKFNVITKDGNVRNFESSVSLRRDRKRQPIGFRGVARDVTEHLKAQKEKQDLENQLHTARAATILGLAKLAEYRDKGTGEHLERIREYAKMIASEMAGLPDYKDYITAKYIDDIFHSSILHDIGKVGIKDSVLLKPGKLDPEEFNIIKRHTILGGDAIAEIESQIEGRSFLVLGKEIAYHHHEKWDGTGYPDGLKGDEIPLSARMVAIADVYDALTTKRFYKDAFTHEKSRDIIIDLKGSHFDPDVVDAFLANEKIFNKICAEKRAEEMTLLEQPEQTSLP